MPKFRVYAEQYEREVASIVVEAASRAEAMEKVQAAQDEDNIDWNWSDGDGAVDFGLTDCADAEPDDEVDDIDG